MGFKIDSFLQNWRTRYHITVTGSESAILPNAPQTVTNTPYPVGKHLSPTQQAFNPFLNHMNARATSTLAGLALQQKTTWHPVQPGQIPAPIATADIPRIDLSRPQTTRASLLRLDQILWQTSTRWVQALPNLIREQRDYQAALPDGWESLIPAASGLVIQSAVKARQTATGVIVVAKLDSRIPTTVTFRVGDTQWAGNRFQFPLNYLLDVYFGQYYALSRLLLEYGKPEMRRISPFAPAAPALTEPEIAALIVPFDAELNTMANPAAPAQSSSPPRRPAIPATAPATPRQQLVTMITKWESQRLKLTRELQANPSLHTHFIEQRDRAGECLARLHALHAAGFTHIERDLSQDTLVVARILMAQYKTPFVPWPDTPKKQPRKAEPIAPIPGLRPLQPRDKNPFRL